MRLHTVSLTAVGPFAETQVIDFDRLGSGGLFLFEGPTGVGKSTILDALTFALYGGLASEAGDAARMRSDFVDEAVRPVVVLDFSVRGQRHRVTRSPEFRRPKLRGTGTTVEKASVHLERWESGAWASRSTAKEEVGTIITDLIGLNRQQFRQVVLLPQGEFATFLRADDDARRDVLVKLFGTHFFRRVTDQLQGIAQAVRAEVQQAELDLATRISAAWEACGRSVEDPGASLSRQQELLEAAGHEVESAATSAAAEASRASLRAAQARSDVAGAEALLERVRRRARVLAVLEAAEAEQPVQRERQDRVAAARRAAPIRPLLELAAGAAERVEQARSLLAETGVADADADDDGTAHAARAESLRSQADRLDVAEAEEAGLAGRRAALHGERVELTTVQEQLAELELRRQALPEDLAEARAAESHARSHAAEAPAIAARLGVLRARLLAAERAAALEADLPRLRSAQRTARRAHDEARHEVDMLVEQRVSDMRGLLAARLVSGDPCAVCGSTEHPAPADALVAGVTEEVVRAAKAARDEAELLRDEADRAVAHAELALASAHESCGGAAVPELADSVAAAEQELVAARASAAEIDGRARRRAELESELEQTTGRLVPLGQAAALLVDSVQRRSEELAAAERRVAQARGEASSVTARIAELTAEATAEQRRAERLAALAAARRASVEADARVEREAQSAGFTSTSQAAAAALPPDELDDLEEQVAEWHSRLAGAREQLASPDLLGVVGVDRAAAEAGLPALRAELERREATAASAERAGAIATERRDRFAARLADVQESAGAHAAALAEAEEVIALDQYARGMAGTPRMTLVTYVLRYWFEQVVQAANLRLQAMSAGKYELVRDDRGTRRDARVGLGLSVLDRHTGRERSPGTLSGGETFYTSLSLALGLADVVVAQAGGAQLDTLFIDEGFGSLDQDTLDDVMGVIDELRGNGRMVGIVSHVPDLKERIAERLSVRRSRPDGPSHVEVHA